MFSQRQTASHQRFENSQEGAQRSSSSTSGELSNEVFGRLTSQMKKTDENQGLLSSWGMFWTSVTWMLVDV